MLTLILLFFKFFICHGIYTIIIAFAQNSRLQMWTEVRDFRILFEELSQCVRNTRIIRHGSRAQRNYDAKTDPKFATNHVLESK